MLNPEEWARLWDALPSLVEELDIYAQMDDEESRAVVQLLEQRVEMAKAAAMCCCPEVVREVAEVCIQHLLNNRQLLRALDFGDVDATRRARFRWLVECVKDGCHE